MLTPEDGAFITLAVEGLAAPLLAGLDQGYTNAHRHYDEHEMTGQGYTKGRTDLTRDHTRKHLDAAKDLGGWKLANSRSGRILLRNQMLTIRVLHAAPFDLVPAPGRNKARISYYSNPAIDLFGVQSSNLLAVWLSPEEEGGQISVRIVRPIGDWKPGRPAKFDLDFELPRDTESFTGWEFVPDDNGIMLPFEFDEDQREEGEGSGA
ncbi:hypothetical protein OG689_42795 [Kitasatospora sp. NBC_00240]|uniref:hypothetical protein n=1 Tax=Kitasatospora sp. NBC_00240 TaxID=2903567 RepID=UPI00225ACE2A|nr:hypothetical protein [Kitasatospora sp. NBC_00240]MCX5215876.1 hypothetical protein [Kitasatospora sp. NBC_00240]